MDVPNTVEMLVLGTLTVCTSDTFKEWKMHRAAEQLSVPEALR
jgi:hypothetical protein